MYMNEWLSVRDDDQALGGLFAPVGVEHMTSGPGRTEKTLFFMTCVCVIVNVTEVYLV
jgi:hypothetical protein